MTNVANNLQIDTRQLNCRHSVDIVLSWPQAGFHHQNRQQWLQITRHCRVVLAYLHGSHPHWCGLWRC